jgi:hypothetical protein
MAFLYEDCERYLLDDLLRYDEIPQYLRHVHAALFLFDMYCKALWNKKNSNAYFISLDM